MCFHEFIVKLCWTDVRMGADFTEVSRIKTVFGYKRILCLLAKVRTGWLIACPADLSQLYSSALCTGLFFA